MQSVFDAASVKIVDVQKNPEYLAGVVAKLHAKYPEYANRADPDTFEDLSSYNSQNDFVIAVIGQNNTVSAFAAGAVLPATKTASMTYMAVDDPADPAIKDLLIQSVSTELARRNIRALFVELYAQGQEPDPERDSKDKSLYCLQGLAIVRIHYRQPSGDLPGNGSRGEDLNLWVRFTNKNITPEQKSALVLDYLKAFAQVYDPENKNPLNRDDMISYRQALADYDWPAPSTPSAALAHKPR